MLIYIVPKINIVIPATTSDTKTQNQKKVQKTYTQPDCIATFLLQILESPISKMYQQQNVAKCINNRKKIF